MRAYDLQSYPRVRIITYNAAYRSAFISLNREWIEKYFEIEEADVAQLERLEETILGVGGEIFFVLENDHAVGTCAMVPHGPTGCFELAKMAVAPEMRGKGYGDLLMDAAISWGKSQGGNEVMLLSNTILESAIKLYRKHQFEVVRLGNHPDYKRSNIEMKRSLDS